MNLAKREMQDNLEVTDHLEALDLRAIEEQMAGLDPKVHRGRPDNAGATVYQDHKVKPEQQEHPDLKDCKVQTESTDFRVRGDLRVNKDTPDTPDLRAARATQVRLVVLELLALPDLPVRTAQQDRKVPLATKGTKVLRA